MDKKFLNPMDNRPLFFLFVFFFINSKKMIFGESVSVFRWS